jgi:UDP-glucose 4-epimerase
MSSSSDRSAPFPPADAGLQAGAYDGKVVLVTGGLGFIGSNLVHRLAAESRATIRIVDSLHPRCGANPHNLDGVARPAQVHTFDLVEAERLPAVLDGVDVVFNLAGQVSHIDSMDFPFEDLDSNARAHLTLLESCRRHAPRARVVYASTRQIYGRPSSLPVDESHAIAPTDVNGIHKFAGEWYHRIYHQAHGLETCALRLTNTYGPRQLIRHSRQGFIGWFIHRLLCGEEVRLFGDGRQMRDLTFVDCVVEAFLRAGVDPRAPGRVYNLGSGEPISLVALVELMIEIHGSGSYRLEPFPEERRRIDIGSYYGDSSLIRDELGWAPRVSLRDGLRRTLEFFGERRSVYLNPA